MSEILTANQRYIESLVESGFKENEAVRYPLIVPMHARLEIKELRDHIKELESQLEQAKKYVDEIHNLYQDDKVFTVYLSEGFYSDEFNELMLKLIYEHDASIQEGK